MRNEILVRGNFVIDAGSRDNAATVWRTSAHWTARGVHLSRKATRLAMRTSGSDLNGIDNNRLVKRLRRTARWNAMFDRRIRLTAILTGCAVGAAALVSDLFGFNFYARVLSMFLVSFLCALLFAKWRRRAERAGIRTALRSLGDRCLACGYDLRGQVEKRCPECGRTPEDVTT